ncbi:MAG: putative SOS response-associated peptidase YedK [Acidimicrobiales bacterium]|jgi:putative SOS response-associated peptidase YedK
MCGRFVSAAPPDELARYFGATAPEGELEPNYNLAPTNEAYVVRAAAGQRAIATLTWGLVPFWSKDRKIGSRMINARSETAPEKPAFRRAYQKRRCLIPADGFYEWAKVEGNKKKQPYFIHHRDDEPLVFGGLWEHWVPKDDDGNDQEDGRLTTCTILTTTANETMAPVHDRMPVFIPPQRWDDWLDPESDALELRSLLVPAPSGLLQLRPVTTMVNSVRNKGPELIVEATPEQLIGAS